MPDADTLAKIGQLLSGISFMFAAIAAWATLFLYHMKERNNRWNDGFRSLYIEFYKDPDITEVRTWIINESLYGTVLRPVLLEREKTPAHINKLTAAENAILEKLDLFCSVMVRAKSLETAGRMTRKQTKLFSKLISGDGIMERLRERNRPEVITYIRTHWPELL